MTAKQRRTQAERRAATTAALIDGTIAALSEVGYSRTTVQEICTRAGVSHGALFGRFSTLLDLMLAAAEEVARRQLDNFARRIAQLPNTEDANLILPLLRTSSRDPINAVWIELLVAARTDAQIRDRLRPISEEYGGRILDSSREIRALDALPEHERAAFIANIVHYFDGEALSGVLYPDAEFERQRLTMLATMSADYLRAHDK